MNTEWISEVTWDGKELIFVRQHSCYDLTSSHLRDIAEIRIRQCDNEKQHWLDLLAKREDALKVEKLNV